MQTEYYIRIISEWCTETMKALEDSFPTVKPEIGAKVVKI
jgi:hypothetical protein